MSWSGTVNCRECYGKGHNRRTCPQLTEQYARRAQSELDGGEGKDGYWGSQYAKRTGKYIDGTDAKALKATRRGSVRRCKYCGTKGHNRRTCAILKVAKTAYLEEALEFRKNILADMKERGLGIGALILTERWGDQHLMLCETVHWNHITHRMGNVDLFKGRLVKNNHHHAAGYPNGDFNETSYYTYTVPGPIGSASIEACVPADFFDPESLTDSLDDYFDKDRRSECYHDNYYA